MSMTGGSPLMSNATFRKLAEGPPILPARIDLSRSALDADKSLGASNGKLIQAEGELVDKISRGPDQFWLLRDGPVYFAATLAQPGGGDRLANIRAGARILVTGICIARTAPDPSPFGVSLLVRSPEDISVVGSTWWFGQNSVWVVAFPVLSSLALLGWALRFHVVFRLSDIQAGVQPESIRARTTARIAGLTSAAIGLSVLAGGWTLGLRWLQCLVPGYAAMRPNAALGLVAAGCALWSSGRKPFMSRFTALLLSAAVVIGGTLTLSEYISGTELGIDKLLFRKSVAGELGGRMAATTAFTFVLAGLALMLMHWERWTLAAQALAVAGSSLCLFTLVGQLYGVDNFFGAASPVPMAVHTAIALLILLTGVLLLRSDRGLMAIVTSRAPGGIMARRLLPAAFCVPVILGWLRWQGQLHGLYDQAFGLALFASSNVVVFALLMWTSANLLNRLDSERSLAEHKLRESESRHRTVVESLPQMVWTCLADGRCDYLSRQWVDYTGIPEEDQLGYAWGQQIHPSDRDCIQAKWKKVVESGGKLDAEYRLRDATGSYRWFRAMAVPLRVTGGITKWFGTSTDIDDVKVMEAALRESEASLRQLAEAMPQIVWTAKPDGSIEYYNQRWYDLTGMTFEQTKDWGWKPVIHPEDLENCIASWTHSVNTGAAYQVECRFRSVHAGLYRWHLGRAEAVRNAEGKITRWFGTCTDIEDYKQADAAIKALNEDLEDRVAQRTVELARANDELAYLKSQLQAVLDAATQVSIIATSTDGVIRLFNSGAEHMLQYKASEMIGIHSPEIIHDQAEVQARSQALSQKLGKSVEGFDVFVAAAREGKSEEREWTYVRKDGSRVDVSLAVTTVYGAGGVLSGFLGVATDITGRESLERQLRMNNQDLAEQTRNAEKANRTKSEFLASMSHEIRTPMNSILGMADLLWDSELTADQRQYVEVFRRAGSNLLTLINDILDVSKIEAGHFEMEHIDFDLEEVVDEAMELIQPKAAAKGIALISRIAPQAHRSLVGDPSRVRQVLINLLGNGVKFTHSGEVSLTVADSDCGRPGFLSFTVSDTGIGIPADQLKTIFDDFTQADSSVTRRYGGTGLGLAISRRVVERMGGELTVTSTAGMGSTFRFDAPLAGANRSRPAQTEVSDFHGKRVLIVDDNPTNRFILRETLTSWGLETDESGTPSEALAAIARQSYAMILLDSQMPAMSGFELAMQIRRTECSAPLIMLTSDAALGDQARRHAAGLAGYAVKPIKRNELLRLVCSALKKSSLDLEPEPSALLEESPAAVTPAGLSILAADDSADNRLLIQAYCKGSPHTLTFVEDGEAAVAAFTSASHFDLILMDTQMPRMDGLTATRKIRAIESERGLKQIPIIVLTANARPEDVSLSQQAGSTAHISKPVSKHRLLKAIEEHGREHNSATQGTIKVVVNPELDELVPGYLRQRRREVQGMLALLAASDYDRLRSLAHDLKGTGSSYGFPELTRFGSDLESAAKVADRETVAKQIPQLADYLSRVELISP